MPEIHVEEVTEQVGVMRTREGVALVLAEGTVPLTREQALRLAELLTRGAQ